MTKLQKKIVGAIATGTLFINSCLPVFAATTVVIEGNGPDTENTVELDQDNTVGVLQDNYASIHNDIQTYASSGGNSVDKATGGDVEITTGDAETNATVTNSVNGNVADVDCCDAGDVDLKIEGNGPDSDNLIDLDNDEKDTGVYVTQKNVAYVDNLVSSNSDTGGNSVKKPTGGSISIDTGDATTKVTVSTVANSNSASVGGGESGELSAWIVGNGPDTENTVDLDLTRQVLVEQDNYASVHNMVKAGAGSGDNSVEKSTGGEVEIDTGDADTTVGVDNAVNFNWADIDCGCLLGDFLYKIAGNGPDSDNLLDIELDGGSWAKQTNVAGSGLINQIGANALTGENEVKKSTGSYDGDPTIDTGDATISATAENYGNTNVVGGLPDLDWPEMPDFSEYDFQFSFNWAYLWAWMGMNG